MYDLNHFGLKQMIESGRALRELGQHAQTMEEAACEVADFLYRRFADAITREPNCVLVRCFKTHPYGRLPVGLQTIVRELMPDGGTSQPEASMKCLCLLASRGELPEWNDRERSRRHAAIPLPSVEMIDRAPMIARLLKQMGLTIGDILAVDEGRAVEANQRSFDVFHVEDAVGSVYVPAQEEFVRPFGVRSVLGFGGLLATGELFAVVMFTRVPVSRDTAELFRTLALSVKLALLPFSSERVFSCSLRVSG